MAADLAGTPTAGLDVQLCGDAHLSNFGVFASPERTLLFDLNDFDETLPGPFEYDVKRMAASFVIGGRNNGFSAADARSAAGASVAAYRKAMTEFAEMGTHGRLVRAPPGRPDPVGRWSGRQDEAGTQDGDRKPARPWRRRRHATACRRCRSSPRRSTGSAASSAIRRCSSPSASSAGATASRRGDGEGGSRTVPRLPLDAPRRPPQAPRTLPPGRHGAQGRGRGQRGHPGIHRVDGWP